MKSNVMNLYVKNGVAFLKYKKTQEIPFVNHCVSTRHGGVSSGKETSSMNLGFNTKDTKENVTRNYERFCQSAGFDPKRLVFASQSHSKNVRYVTDIDCGKGIYLEKDYTDVDALITDIPNIPLVIHTADCVPVAFIDTKRKVIGNAHCGWRGTYENLALITLNEMTKRFGTSPHDVVCTIGPAICKECYEVSEDLYVEFKNRFGFEDAIIYNGRKYYLDLMNTNKKVLENAGVKEIALSDLCTCCNKDNLFSHRGLGPKRGLISSIIEIKG